MTAFFEIILLALYTKTKTFILFSAGFTSLARGILKNIICLFYFALCSFQNLAANTPVLVIELPPAAADSLPSAQRAPNKTSELRILIAGHLESGRIFIDGEWYPLDPNKSFNSEVRSVERESGSGTSNLNPPPLGSLGPSASFRIGVNPEGSCRERHRLRDFRFFLKAMSKSIERATVTRNTASACVEQIAEAIRQSAIDFTLDDQFKPGSMDAEPQIIVRVFFKTSESTTQANDSDEALTRDLDKKDAAESAVTHSEPSTSTNVNAMRVIIDDQPIPILSDGWFLHELRAIRGTNITVVKDEQIIFQKRTTPMVLRQGFNPGYSTSRWGAIVLVDSDRSHLQIRTLDEKELRGFNLPVLGDISVPVYLKGGFGYARIDPLPDENDRGRLAMYLGARSYPFFERFHLSLDFAGTSKSNSKLPWTVTTTLAAGTDLIQLSSQWSMPVEIGARIFHSRVARTDPLQQLGRSIKIPTSTLTPVLKFGVSWRSGLLYAELASTLAGVFVTGADPIITLSPRVSGGYQWTAVDLVALQILREDTRYPSQRGEAKIVVSSVTLNYQRDLL